jgi:anti-sigma-K factor RskA
MVSFTTIRYSDAIKRWNRQTWWINAAATTSAVVTLGIGAGLGLCYGRPLIDAMSKYLPRS